MDVGLAILYAVVIFVLGSLRNTPAAVQEVSDKLEHAVGFALLAWLWCRALVRLSPGSSRLRVGVAAFALSVALGGALELWQGLLGYRSCELMDWVADGVGAAIAAGVHTALGVWLGTRAGALR